MSSSFGLGVACVLVLFSTWSATDASAQERGKRLITAVRIDQAPTVDGVLDDPAWQSAALIDDFTQQEPHEGEAATEPTEVRVMYDSQNLYIAVHAFDSQPSGIVASEMRRDADRLLDEDSFQIVLDTFNDSRNGYMFVTTPLGAKLEQQISAEGESSSRSGNENINRNWDGVWYSTSRMTEDGWIAEIAIPMTTLRFLPSEQQVWGINFQRNIRRKNEIVLWAPVPKAYTLTRVSLAGKLTGLGSINRGLDLKLKPYVLGGARQNALTAPAPTSALHDIGIDAKYGVTAGLNLDLTYNTDFAQVEADEQQVNLTRFSIVYPEKRDFFLENAGLFYVGQGKAITFAPLQTDLFFSRRIGLSSTGQPVPIIAGARLSGKTGRHNVAVLDVQTDAAFGKPGENFFVSRYSRDVLKRSRVGALFINKNSTGAGTHSNQTMALDASLMLTPSLQVTSYVSKTATPGRTGRDMSYFGRIAYRNREWNVNAAYSDIQDNFNPEVGFIQRAGVRAGTFYFSPTPRPGKAHIRLLEPMYVLTYVTDQNNRMVNRYNHYMVGSTLDDGSVITVIYQQNLDVLDQPFAIQPGIKIPPGTYKFDQVTLTYNTSPARRVYERLTFLPMEFYGGTRRNLVAAVGVRASSRFSTELQYERNDVKLPWGSFLGNLAILRVDYAFSPTMTLRSLTQYNSLTHEFTNNVRFNLIYRPGSDLYVVYSDLRQTGLPTDAFAPSDRQVVVKMTYLLSR